MGQRTELFEGKACLAETAGRGVTYILAEDVEGAPKGKGLEGKDDFHIGCFSHMLDKLQVAAKQRFLNKIIRTHGES